MYKLGSLEPDVRRADRLEAEFEAMIREPGMTKFPIKVKDLSATGFRCETSFTLRNGARVWLTIPGLAGLEATVVWKEQFRYGVAFVAPLHVAVFEHIVRSFGNERDKQVLAGRY